MKDSEIVLALANIASQGKYNITIADAQKMTALYERVATLINKLEAAEAVDKAWDTEEELLGGVRDVVEAELSISLADLKSLAQAEPTGSD